MPIDDSSYDEWEEHQVPRPGSLLRARVAMRPWENDDERGRSREAFFGSGVLLSIRRVGKKQVRFQVLAEGTVMTFSHSFFNFFNNWDVVTRT